MSGDPRAPVIVGVGQISAKGTEDVSPLGLMVEAAQRALADSGAGEKLLKRLDSLAVPYTFSWQLQDPGRIVAAELGASPRETVRSGTGGTAPLMLLGDICERIQAGELDVALITGGEAVNPFMEAMTTGDDPGWPSEPEGAEPDRMLPGDPAEAGHPAEIAANLIAPISYYPLFEHAIRAASGVSITHHRHALGKLWERVGAPARTNPHAWTPDVPDAAGIADPSERNRLAMDPYTKLMTANIQVDQGAALVLCSAQAADEMSIDVERRAFVRSVGHATDHWYVGERERLDRSPAIGGVSGRALPHAGLGINEIEHLDIYSCFPAAVQIAAAELGIDLDTDSRPLSVTGGLTFAGGPANNYCAHSLAAMVERLREQPGAGLVTSVGWYMTKHALAVLSSEPGPAPFARFNVQEEVDALPRRAIADAVEVEAEIETYTAAYDREANATVGVVACLLPDGSRAFAKSGDTDVIGRLLAGDPIGRTVSIATAEFDL